MSARRALTDKGLWGFVIIDPFRTRLSFVPEGKLCPPRYLSIRRLSQHCKVDARCRFLFRLRFWTPRECNFSEKHCKNRFGDTLQGSHDAPRSAKLCGAIGVGCSDQFFPLVIIVCIHGPGSTSSDRRCSRDVDSQPYLCSAYAYGERLWVSRRRCCSGVAC